ncbi:MAG: HAMP domain-containing histidine kinase [Actinomycetia bacterium]|nr:HAMP domain-containing histidine kinase [Actinomycetes bacterium]
MDRFLRDRADEIVSGQRLDPRDRNGGRARQGDDRGEASGATIDDGAIQATVDADAEVQRLDSTGTVEYSVGVALPVSDADIDVARERSPSLLRTVTVDGTDYRMITHHIDGGGAIQVARDLGSTNDVLGAIQNRMFIVGLILSVLAAGAGWLVARGTTRPLRHLTNSVEAVAETQDLSVAVSIDRSDEIGRLAKSFDRMLGALALSREQQHQLVDDAAHELRTPLTSIHANIELLSRAPDLDDDVRQATLAAARSELRQLNVLITEIIELATNARDAPDLQTIDLAVIVEEAVRSFQRRGTAPIGLRATSSLVSGIPTSLQRAVDNLLLNADKYSPEGAPIMVDVAEGSVAVTDRGPGIPVAERERVFDRFYRSEFARSQPGSGLGLAIVNKIIKDHSGQVWITDGPEGGTRAGFTLPTV